MASTIRETMFAVFFGEKLTANEARVAIEEWREAFASKIGQSVILIWDCRKMKGYESEARTIWTGALKEMKSQIATIWLISDSTIIKMGASVMGMLCSIKIKAVSSENDIEV